MTLPLDCPESDCWQALLDPNLPPEQLGRFEQHLALCPTCQDRLDRAPEGEEELRQYARRVGDPTVAPADRFWDHEQGMETGQLNTDISHVRALTLTTDDKTLIVGGQDKKISFVCSSCGAKLKAKRALAGKKVKCSQCAQAVSVPSIQEGESN